MTTTKQFDKRLQNLPSAIWQKIAKIDELKGRWVAGAQLNPQVLSRLKRSVLVTSTGASTRIEGAHLSDEDVEKLMRGLSMQKFADRDKQEVQGYYELLQNVFNHWKSLRFSESTIKHFHNELLKYVDKDERHRGSYKLVENKVEMRDESGKTLAVLFNPTPPYLTPIEMQELVDWTGQVMVAEDHHPLLIVGNFIVEFLNIHPFQDGNGRLSRILTNLLLLKAGYQYMPYISHEKFVEDNKSDYYVTLRKSQQTIKTEVEDITPWLDFFLDIFLKQSEKAIRLLSEEDIEAILSPNQLAVWHYLQTVEETTPGQITQVTGVARPTINQVLTKLLKLKRIKRLGFGRATRYKKA